MICVAYYPSNASGAHRAVANAKYLPIFGWEPVVLCKKYSPGDPGGTYDPQLAVLPDICSVIRIRDTKSRVIKKVERAFWAVVGGGKNDYRYPFLLYQGMKRAAEQLIKTQRIDAIWATYSLGLDHRIADYLSRKYNIPWVADFRDLPDQSYDGKNTRYVVKQEIRTCSTATALIATSDELANKLKNRHSTPVFIVLNGFDPTEYEASVILGEYDAKFTLNHFGVLYKFRNPCPLFAAVDKLSQQKTIDLNDININFYGADRKMVDEFSRGYRCASQVNVPSRLPYPEMVERQKQSQILLLVAPPEQGGAIPAKLYGYLASHRPILNIPGDGAGTDRILKQTNAGITLSDPERIASWLEHAYQSWKHKGIIGFEGDEIEIQRYSRKTQAGQLAEILETVVFGKAAYTHDAKQRDVGKD
jgi:hypothetical protein